MPRNSQISRIYSILNLLEGNAHGLSVSDITSRMCERGHKASKRTIYRDLEALASAGFPLFPADQKVTDQSTLWVLEKTAKIEKYLVLNPRELVGLYLARAILTPLKGSPFFNDLNQMFEKIESKIGSKAKNHLQEISEEIKFEPAPQLGLGVSPEILETIRLACTEGHLIQCIYRSTSATLKSVQKPRVLGPHFIYFSKGSLYLIAKDFSDSKQTTKTFALPRIQEAQMLEEAFESEKLDPEAYFKNSFGVFTPNTQIQKPVEVIIEFESTVGSYVKERIWHSSQKIKLLTNGKVELNLELSLTPDFVHWVLGFGAQAKVISPRELQSKIVGASKQITALYELAPIKKVA